MRSTFALIAILSANLTAQTSLKALSGQFEGLVEKTDPAVVQIVVRAFTAPDDEDSAVIRSAKGNGSGAIVSADGYIVTNSHVVANARRIQVLLPRMMQMPQSTRSVLRANGKLVNAQLIGQDRETDIAVLKIEGAAPMPFIQFGDSETLREGQLVFAFGSPLGLDNSVTMGIVSATARQVRPDDPMIYIQTDAAITRAIPVGRWSIPTASWSGSTRSFIRIQAALKASALLRHRTSSRVSTIRSASMAE